MFPRRFFYLYVANLTTQKPSRLPNSPAFGATWRLSYLSRVQYQHSMATGWFLGIFPLDYCTPYISHCIKRVVRGSRFKGFIAQWNIHYIINHSHCHWMGLVYVVVSTHLKNISQFGSFPPPIGMNIKNVWNHHPVVFVLRLMTMQNLNVSSNFICCWDFCQACLPKLQAYEPENFCSNLPHITWWNNLLLRGILQHAMM